MESLVVVLNTSLPSAVLKQSQAQEDGFCVKLEAFEKPYRPVATVDHCSDCTDTALTAVTDLPPSLLS